MNVDDDALLDKITAKLRTESVPEMPVELASNEKRDKRTWIWYGLAAGALAASIAALAVWPPRHEERASARVVERQRLKSDSAVVVQVVDLTESLQRIESTLNGLGEEIRELKVRATLLDARRKADELLAKF